MRTRAIIKNGVHVFPDLQPNPETGIVQGLGKAVNCMVAFEFKHDGKPCLGMVPTLLDVPDEAINPYVIL